MAQDLVTSAYRHLGVRRVKVPRHLTSRNPEPRSTESTQSRAHGFGAWSQRSRPRGGALRFIIWQDGSRRAESDLSHSSQRDTWCTTRLFSFSPITTLKRKEQLFHIPKTRSVEDVPDPSPQYYRISSGPSDQRGTHGTH
jgi:hypothetical protein